MKKIEKYIFIGCGVMIVILWILSSTELILKEKKTEVYQISVIVDDKEEKNWEYFQKGIEYASDQYHVEVKFITLYDGVSQKKQNELIEKEALGDAQLLVVSPVNVQEFQEFLVENSLKEKPVITLKTQVQSDKIVSCLYSDEAERARQLGEVIAEEIQDGEQVWIGVSREKKSNTQQFCDALRQSLEEHQIESSIQVWTEEEELHDVLKNSETILVGLDMRTTELLAEKVGEREKGNRKIYGNGMNASIVHSMEEGKIDGIAVVNETDMGCLAVANAIDLLEGNKIADTLLNQYVIRSSEIYSKQYEQVLFPIS